MNEEKKDVGYPQADLRESVSEKGILAESLREYTEDPNRLFNDSVPLVDLQREKPEHRLVVELKARGMTHREIAALTGYTTVAISYIVRQPWARKRILELIQTSVKAADPCLELLKQEAANNLQTLIDIRDGAFDAEPSTRAAAANALLDRLWGKPTQKVEQKISRVSLDSVADLEREEARLAAEEARLLGRLPGAPVAAQN